MSIFVHLLATLLQVAPVPPPVDQAQADCASPSYADDMAVCGDQGLRELDRRMGAALPGAEARTGYLIEPQREWFRRSRACSTRKDQLACLRVAYRERIAVLAAARRPMPASAAWQPCRRSADRVAFVDGGIIVIRRAGGTYLASAATELHAWRPWLYATLDRAPDRSPRRIAFRWLDARKTDCTLQQPRSANP